MLSFFYRNLLLTVALLMGPLAAVAQQPLGELYATDASVRGSVVLAGSGTSVLSGSSIEAGAQAATLKLDRGGNVLVCQGTRLSITASQNGRSLMFSLNSGNLEMNYPLGAAADTLLTPDLHLLMPGPGTVHVAVHVTPQGDTCVQSLPANASAIVVSETMGDATYQVKADEAVLFKGGRLSQASRSTQACGCPAPPPTQVAKGTPPPPPPAPLETKPATTTATPVAAPSPDQHIAVEAPFIFHGDDPVPDLSQNVATLKLESNKMLQLDPVVEPPPPGKKSAGNQKSSETARKESKHGFLSRVGSFFATLFH